MLPRGSEWDSGSAGEQAAVRAPVTPRVYSPHTGEPLPLADCVRKLIDRRTKGVICLHGPPGSGKSTALRHLRAVLPAETCPILLDGHFSPDPNRAADDLMIHTGNAAVPNTIPLQMASWSQDDCIEYLLTVHPSKIGPVMSRVQALPNASALDGRAELWRILLDAFAEYESMTEIAVALRLALAPLLTLHGGPIGLHCLESLSQGHDLSGYPELALPTRAGRLVRHRAVQLVMAADRIVEQLCDQRGASELETVLPEDLIREVARLSAFWPAARDRLNVLSRCADGAVQSMTISTLTAMDPAWQPNFRPARLAKAMLKGVDWHRVNLTKADVCQAQFDNADLRHLKLRKALAGKTNFSGANLRYASLGRMIAGAADFSGADLSYARANGFKGIGANFQDARLNAAWLARAQMGQCNMNGASFIGAHMVRADLKEATLDGADFTDANLRRAILDHCDLTVATFSRAIFKGASLRHCNLATMSFPNVDFSNAFLTGSDLTGCSMPNANFDGANLCNTGLADVDWERASLCYADLRNSSFHLGSTRSGLVGSTIASEGTRTGFYTDDYDEHLYRQPEEIRKANLRGANLRGANIDGVDFYLVDLRGAIYTDAQREQFVACRAILD